MNRNNDVVNTTTVRMPFLNGLLSLRIYCCDLGSETTTLLAPTVARALGRAMWR